MKQLVLFLSLFIAFHISSGQISYTAANAINSSGTYTDLGSSGTPITTLSASFDDDVSAPQNIGFSFLFNGSSFTQFVLNTNGLIELGTNAPPNDTYDALAATDANLIYPFSADLIAGVSTPEYRLFTSGVAPNRVCTIQFKNLRDYEAGSTPSQFDNINFQIKLYETSNNIEFVYGSFSASAASPADLSVAVGIKGADAANSLNVSKIPTDAWSLASFLDGDYTGDVHITRNTVLPDPGRTYRFVYAATLNNDAQVSNVYTLSKIPVSFGAPHVVSTIIANKGVATINNLTVTLKVTGANTFTDTKNIASLAPGASTTINFAAYSPATAGTNTVTVSVPADDNSTNNSIAVSQSVNANTYSYADNLTNSGYDGYSAGLSGMFLTKYKLTGIAYVNHVNIFIPNVAVNVGKTIYAVVLDPAGVILGQSANYTITVGDLDGYKSFSFVVPPFINGGDFYVGLAQTANATRYYPLALQTETPARPASYYTVPSLAGGIVPSEITSLGRFMMEAVVSINALPVRLTGFAGSIQNNTALLNWLTYENADDHFEIEKANASGGSWAKIGKVNATPGSSLVNRYQFTDAGISSGKWMYRLKIFDKTGSFTYSPVIVLQLKGSSLFVLDQNYPNPVADVTMIRYELAKDAIVALELYSMDGKKIMAQQKGKQLKGAYNIPVNVKTLAMPAGKYIYRMIVQDIATGDVTAVNKEMNVIR
jgi:hypothetical protein